ncbi:MAG: hypothetical protein PHE56_16145 [Bacteroidales bacterium]|nr:hypothetical protein [Bacteroidales bacterium]
MNKIKILYEEQNALFDTEYIRRLRNNRTTIFLLIWLVVKRFVSLKYAYELMLNPVEISLFNNQSLTDDEEILSSDMGLRLIYEGCFITWDGYVVFEDDGKTQYKRHKLI